MNYLIGIPKFSSVVVSKIGFASVYQHNIYNGMVLLHYRSLVFEQEIISRNEKSVSSEYVEEYALADSLINGIVQRLRESHTIY